MGVANLSLVSVEITALDGVDLIEPLTVFTGQSFPEVNGNVMFEVFGEQIIAPSPTVDLVEEEDIDVAGIGILTLSISVQHIE
ncbi:hypothetical protein CR203_03535 [Salipaludibacillus neizhouensis]|uniref:Uncharacterized protein n=1 Tax=Salipaludibacillus neizhouensis TaxID=885475 RepID=A0A3A9KEP0_9BACI|nr:hypothetical protein [Salipaludibacillus neizhouensis]RKL69120.1 hypothetical protein CR203_03535 [Salipaludibacillus neizhouensis]